MTVYEKALAKLEESPKSWAITGVAGFSVAVELTGTGEDLANYRGDADREEMLEADPV